MKKQILISAGLIALGVVLVVAAFTGGQLFRAQQQAKAAIGQQGVPRKLVTPAAGVPSLAPDVAGDAIGRDGNSLFVCLSDPGMTVNADGTINKNGACDLQVEVVIGHDTTFIHDVSALHNPNPVKQGQDYVIQEYVEPGSAGDIAAGTVVRAWGTRSGNRLLAQTLLYWNRSPRPAVTPGP